MPHLVRHSEGEARRIPRIEIRTPFFGILTSRQSRSCRASCNRTRAGRNLLIELRKAHCLRMTVECARVRMTQAQGAQRGMGFLQLPRHKNTPPRNRTGALILRFSCRAMPSRGSPHGVPVALCGFPVGMVLDFSSSFGRKSTRHSLCRHLLQSRFSALIIFRYIGLALLYSVVTLPWSFVISLYLPI